MKNKVILINIAEEFIKKNNLGRTDIFTINEEEKNYTDIENKRLDYLLAICDDLISEKISVDSLQSIIKDRLQISDNLSKEIFEEIISSKNDEPEQVNNEIEIDSNIINQKSKKSIFSAVINGK
jgi:bacterioferritin (cytochrome b1)